MTEASPATSARDSVDRKKRRIPVYVFLIRWWSVGAVYFFIAWGTGLGSRESVADLVFFLGLSIGIFNSLIVNPALKMLFDVGWHRPYADSTFGERMVVRGKDLSLALASSILVFLIYRGINTAAIGILGLPEDQVFLPGEPILYGLTFTVASMLIVLLARMVSRIFRKERKQ